MRVTIKGQVTIPKEIRDGLGIMPGSEVNFALREGEAVLRPVLQGTDARDRAAADLVSHVKRFRGAMDLGGLTADEFMLLLRDD